MSSVNDPLPAVGGKSQVESPNALPGNPPLLQILPCFPSLVRTEQALVVLVLGPSHHAKQSVLIVGTTCLRLATRGPEWNPSAFGKHLE